MSGKITPNIPKNITIKWLTRQRTFYKINWSPSNRLNSVVTQMIWLCIKAANLIIILGFQITIGYSKAVYLSITKISGTASLLNTPRVNPLANLRLWVILSENLPLAAKLPRCLRHSTDPRLKRVWHDRKNAEWSKFCHFWRIYLNSATKVARPSWKFTFKVQERSLFAIKLCTRQASLSILSILWSRVNFFYGDVCRPKKLAAK